MKLFEVLPPYLIQVNTNSKVIYTDVVDSVQDLNLNSGHLNKSSTLITAKCFHMQVEVAVLNAISQNYNFFEVKAKGFTGSESNIGNPFSAYRILHIYIYSGRYNIFKKILFLVATWMRVL